MPRRFAVALIGALLVTSMFAAASLPAGAVPTGPEHAAAAGSSSYVLESGGTYWRGFNLEFDGSRVVGDPASASDAERTFQIRGVDGDEVGGLVREFTVDADGMATIDTSTLSGHFVIQYQGDTVYVTDGEGYLDPPDEPDATVNNSKWEVKEETFAVDWEDPTVYDGQHTAVTLSSNRDGDATVAVSAPGLTFNDLTRVFASSDFATNFAERSNQDVLLLQAGGDHTYELAVSGLSPGTISLTFESADTAASVTTSLEVKDGGMFGDVEKSEEAGDLVDVSVKCSSCYLMVGGKDQGFVDLMQVSDGNGDGFVNLTMNTRYIGLYQGATGVPSNVEAYSSATDSIDRYDPGDRLESIPKTQKNDFLNALRDELGLDPNGRAAPVPAGTVDLTVTGSDYLMTRDQYGDHRAPLGGEPVARDEKDVTTVVLREPTLRRIRPYGLSVNFGKRENLTQLTQGLQARETVAMGDRLVLQIDVTGLDGYFEHHGTDLVRVLDNREEGIDLALRPVDGAERVRLDRSWTWLAIDRANDRVYAVIDSSPREARRALEMGQPYRATFTLSGVDGGQPSYNVYSSNAGHDGYPYLPPGGQKQVATTVTFVEPTATVHRAPSGAVEVTNANPVTVTGDTTLAPGSIVTVTASGSGGASWDKSTSVTVGPNRTWRAEFDFSNIKVGTGFSLRVTKDGTTLATADGSVVEDPATPAPTATRTSTATTGDTPAESSPTPGTPGSTPGAGDGGDGGTATATSDGGGGGLFGFLPGLSDLPVSGGLLVPGAAIVVVFGLIALGIGRLR